MDSQYVEVENQYGRNINLVYVIHHHPLQLERRDGTTKDIKTLPRWDVSSILICQFNKPIHAVEKAFYIYKMDATIGTLDDIYMNSKYFILKRDVCGLFCSDIFVVPKYIMANQTFKCFKTPWKFTVLAAQAMHRSNKMIKGDTKAKEKYVIFFVYTAEKLSYTFSNAKSYDKHC